MIQGKRITIDFGLRLYGLPQQKEIKELEEQISVLEKASLAVSDEDPTR